MNYQVQMTEKSQNQVLGKTNSNSITARVYAKKLTPLEKEALRWFSTMVNTMQMHDCIWYDWHRFHAIEKIGGKKQRAFIRITAIPIQFLEVIKGFLEEYEGELSFNPRYNAVDFNTLYTNIIWFANIKKLIR